MFVQPEQTHIQHSLTESGEKRDSLLAVQVGADIM